MNEDSFPKTAAVLPTNLCQIEIRVTKMQRALDFYQQVFGWNRVPAELANYNVLDVPIDCPFGIALVGNLEATAAEISSKNSGIVMYFKVNDLKPYLEKIPKAGGKVLISHYRMPGYGTVCQFEDTEGNCWGLFSN